MGDEKASMKDVLAAVTQRGMSLEAASEELKNNKEIVLAAVRQDARAIKFVGEKLKGDIEVMLAFEMGVLEYS